MSQDLAIEIAGILSATVDQSNEARRRESSREFDDSAFDSRS